MKIAICSGITSSLGGFRLPLIRQLVASGHQVETISPEYDHITFLKMEELGVKMHYQPLSRSGRNPLADLVYVVRMWRQLAAIRPDATLAYTHKPCIYGLMAARLAGVPSRCAYITGLGYPFMPEPGIARAALRLAMRCLYRLSSQATTSFVFQNADDLAHFLDIGVIRPEHRVVLVGGSGVPLEEFTPTPLPATTRFLMLSRLLVSKGVALYIDAAKRLSAEEPAAEFVLAGAPDDSPDGIPAAHRAALEAGSPVGYLGKIADVRGQIARSSAVVLPSYYREGVPRSLLEALACGRPVITTDMPGCRETLLPGVLARGEGWERRANGYLITPRSEAALAGALVDFARLSPPIRVTMAAESRRLAEQKFDANVVSQTIEAALVEGVASQT